MSLQKESVSEKLVKRDSDNLRKNGEQLKAIRLQNKNEWEKIWEKFVLHDAVLDVFASPEVGDKFEPEKYNYANQKLNALTGYIYTRGKNVIQEILSTREKEIAEEVEKMKRRLEDISTDVVDDGITLNFIPLAKIKVLDEVLSILKH